MFEPAGERHAIVEAVVGVTLARQINPAEAQALNAKQADFKSRLPKVGILNAVEFALGPQGPIAPHGRGLPVIGVQFERVQPDGSLEWRLKAEGNSILVNCLSYQGWDHFWPYAKGLINDCLAVLGRVDNPVTGAIVQYIDIFPWNADTTAYNLGLLLNRDSPNIPPATFDRGPLWHLHQGWLHDVKEPAVGKLLERFHWNGNVREDGVYFTRADIFLNLTLGKPLASHGVFKEIDRIDSLFEHLHDLNKDLLRSYITPEMADRIGLGAA